MAALGIMDFYVPFILIIVCNIIIGVVIIKRSNRLKLTFFKDFRKAAKQKTDVKSAKALVVLVFAFLITWAPHEILRVLDPICNRCVSVVLLWVSYYLVWFNASLNPFIYPLMQKDMRNTLRSLLCCGKTKVAPIPLETPKVTTLLVEGHENRKNMKDKAPVPPFLTIHRTPDAGSTEPSLSVAENPCQDKTIRAEPDFLRTYYLKNSSRVKEDHRVCTVQRSKHLSRGLPTGPTKSRDRLMKHSRHQNKSKLQQTPTSL